MKISVILSGLLLAAQAAAKGTLDQFMARADDKGTFPARFSIGAAKQVMDYILSNPTPAEKQYEARRKMLLMASESPTAKAKGIPHPCPPFSKTRLRLAYGLGAKMDDLDLEKLMAKQAWNNLPPHAGLGGMGPGAFVPPPSSGKVETTQSGTRAQIKFTYGKSIKELDIVSYEFNIEAEGHDNCGHIFVAFGRENVVATWQEPSFDPRGSGFKSINLNANETDRLMYDSQVAFDRAKNTWVSLGDGFGKVELRIGRASDKNDTNVPSYRFLALKDSCTGGTCGDNTMVDGGVLVDGNNGAVVVYKKIDGWKLETPLATRYNPDTYAIMRSMQPSGLQKFLDKQPTNYQRKMFSNKTAELIMKYLLTPSGDPVEVQYDNWRVDQKKKNAKNPRYQYTPCPSMNETSIYLAEATGATIKDKTVMRPEKGSQSFFDLFSLISRENKHVYHGDPHPSQTNHVHAFTRVTSDFNEVTYTFNLENNKGGTCGYIDVQTAYHPALGDWQFMDGQFSYKYIDRPMNIGATKYTTLHADADAAYKKAASAWPPLRDGYSRISLGVSYARAVGKIPIFRFEGLKNTTTTSIAKDNKPVVLAADGGVAVGGGSEEYVGVYISQKLESFKDGQLKWDPQKKEVDPGNKAPHRSMAMVGEQDISSVQRLDALRRQSRSKAYAEKKDTIFNRLKRFYQNAL